MFLNSILQFAKSSRRFVKVSRNLIGFARNKINAFFVCSFPNKEKSLNGGTLIQMITKKQMAASPCICEFKMRICELSNNEIY